MQMKQKQKMFLSRILCIVLIVAMALFTTGCNGKQNAESPAAEIQTTQGESSSSEIQTTQGESSSAETYATDENTDSEDGPEVLGEGDTQFLFVVVDQEGNEKQFEIHTEKTIVGEALQELGLIDGEESEYGLYVKTVTGITADYDKDGVYWAFYINGEYAMSGVDSTTITPGDTYSFKVE